MNSHLKHVSVSNRQHWRAWLKVNHGREPRGIWLVFDKKSGRPKLHYEEAVEEALCFGWIDSVVRRIDEEKYCRKFTPRKERSLWSKLNRERAARMIASGRMTSFGLVKIKAAKLFGHWGQDPRPGIPLRTPAALATALARNDKARAHFEALAPTYRKHYVGWIAAARRPETIAARVKQSVSLLAKGQPLGLR